MTNGEFEINNHIFALDNGRANLVSLAQLVFVTKFVIPTKSVVLLGLNGLMLGKRLSSRSC